MLLDEEHEEAVSKAALGPRRENVGQAHQLLRAAPLAFQLRGSADDLGSQRLRTLTRRIWSAVDSMDVQRAKAFLQRIDIELARSTSAPPRLHLEAALARAVAAALSDQYDIAIPIVRGVLGAHEDASAHPATSVLLLFEHWKERDISGFYAQVSRTPELPSTPHNLSFVVYRRALEAVVELEQLNLGLARRLAQEGLDLCRLNKEQDIPGARLASSIVLQVLYETDRLREAEELLQSQPALRQEGDVEGALRTYIVMARMAVAREDVKSAVRLLQEGEETGRRHSWPRLVAEALTERLRLHLEAGEIAEARTCMHALDQLATESHSCQTDSVLPLGRCITLARCLLEIYTGPTIATLDTIDTLRHQAMHEHDKYHYVRLSLYLALTLSLLHQSRVREVLSESLTLGRSSGLYRVFLDSGAAARNLLEHAYQSDSRDDIQLGDTRLYLRTIVNGFTASENIREARPVENRSSELLSKRETKVLSLMSRGLSNKQIAKDLGVAPETIKTHVKNISLKLSVHTRVEAVSRGISLDLI